MPHEDSDETRTILVDRSNGKSFRITIPVNAKTTFAPWSPPQPGYQRTVEQLAGTLRIYRTEKDIIAVFSGVTGFRDVDMNYEEKVIVEEGATIWKTDKNEYTRETKVTRDEQWEIEQ